MNEPNEQDDNNRRAFLVTGTCMAGELVAGYGTLAAMAGRFLYPTEDGSMGCDVAERFYQELIPQAREIVDHTRDEGREIEADAVSAIIDNILGRPEHR